MQDLSGAFLLCLVFIEQDLFCIMAPKELPFVKKELEVIVLNPTNLPCVNYHKLSILQGSLKTLSETNRAKLCKSILEHGFFIPAFIWRSGEDMYILDATQRYHALEELERKGYNIPAIPYIEIEAKDKKDAAKKLLQITSRYGEINTETSFFTDFDIEIDYLNEISIPELEIKFDTKFDSFSDIIKDYNENNPEGSSHAITFVFTEEDHKMIMSYIGKNSRKDIVDEIVRFCTGTFEKEEVKKADA